MRGGVDMARIIRDLRFGMTISEEEMKILDFLSERAGMTRSGYIRYILNQLRLNGVATANIRKENING